MSKKNNTKANTSAKKEAPKADNTVNWGESVKIAAILFAICAVITALLAGTNMLTEDKIAQNSLLEKQVACQAVLPEAEEFVEFEGDYDVYIAIRGGEVVGCTITTAAGGYGGDVTIMVGFDMEGDITGVDVIEHSETPGLGANADKPSFLDQFRSEDGTGHSDDYAVTKDGGEVDAVTAATISSRAVTEALDEACDIYEELSENGELVIPETNEGGEE